MSWRLLNETQRFLYCDVMLENFALITSLDCSCEMEEDEVIPSEQSLSVGESQVRTSRSGPEFSVRSIHPEESSL